MCFVFICYVSSIPIWPDNNLDVEPFFHQFFFSCNVRFSLPFFTHAQWRRDQMMMIHFLDDEVQMGCAQHACCVCARVRHREWNGRNRARSRVQMMFTFKIVIIVFFLRSCMQKDNGIKHWTNWREKNTYTYKPSKRMKWNSNLHYNIFIEMRY